MGKFKLGLLGLGLALILSACAGGPPNTPTGTAQAFLDKLSNMDFDGAASMATEEGASMLKGMKGMLSMMPKEEMDKAKGKKSTLGAVTETGDTATVEYTSEGAAAQTLNLKKVGGVWKVDFKKDMGGM